MSTIGIKKNYKYNTVVVVGGEVAAEDAVGLNVGDAVLVVLSITLSDVVVESLIDTVASPVVTTTAINHNRVKTNVIRTKQKQIVHSVDVTLDVDAVVMPSCVEVAGGARVVLLSDVDCEQVVGRGHTVLLAGIFKSIGYDINNN